MSEKKKGELLIDHNHDGIDRRGFLKCMAWAGTGALCVMEGGRPEVVQPEQNVGVGTQGRWRTELRPNQRQSHGI